MLTPSSLAQRRRERLARPSPGDGFSGTAAFSQGQGGCDGLDPSITLLSLHLYAPSLCPSGKSHPEWDSYEAKGIQNCLTQKETQTGFLPTCTLSRFPSPRGPHPILLQPGSWVAISGAGHQASWEQWPMELELPTATPAQTAPPRPLNCLPPPAWEPPHTTTLTTPSHPRNINAPFIPTWQGLLERRGQEGGGDPE